MISAINPTQAHLRFSGIPTNLQMLRLPKKEAKKPDPTPVLRKFSEKSTGMGFVRLRFVEGIPLLRPSDWDKTTDYGESFKHRTSSPTTEASHLEIDLSPKLASNLPPIRLCGETKDRDKPHDEYYRQRNDVLRTGNMLSELIRLRQEAEREKEILAKELAAKLPTLGPALNDKLAQQEEDPMVTALKAQKLEAKALMQASKPAYQPSFKNFLRRNEKLRWLRKKMGMTRLTRRAWKHLVNRFLKDQKVPVLWESNGVQMHVERYSFLYKGRLIKGGGPLKTRQARPLS